MKIGLTGGMGSGKTTVCHMFESLGIPVYYADTRAKKIMVENKEVKQKIKQLLSNNAYFRNGRPDRKFIAGKVFSNPDLLQALNAIIHPAVHQDFEDFYRTHSQKAPYVVNEAALLVENGSYKRFDRLIVVTCPEEIRVKRIVKRDKITPEAVYARLKNQLPESEKIRHAHFLIDNSGEKSLIPQVWSIHQALISKSVRD